MKFENKKLKSVMCKSTANPKAKFDEYDSI